MNSEDRIYKVFTREALDQLLPAERSDQFFDALLGDPADGAYDIRLAFKAFREHRLHFELELHKRPGKCLACSLTYGLPAVFARHPVIDLDGMVRKIDGLLAPHARCGEWKLGATREVTRSLHAVPLTIEVES